MKLNEHTALLTPSMLLVPYSTHHVPTYHSWMQDPDLQKATASEPLTLSEEHAMQKSWREDGDKLTFIACMPPDDVSITNDAGMIELQGGSEDVDSAERMVGDINLFLVESEEDGGEGDCIGEVEIMVAKAGAQGKGLGTVILQMFLWYVLSQLDEIVKEYSSSSSLRKTCKVMRYLRVKIDAGNARSIRLFEKVGFTKISEKPNYFNELELRLAVPGAKKGIEVAGLLGIDEPKIALYHLTSS